VLAACVALDAAGVLEGADKPAEVGELPAVGELEPGELEPGVLEPGVLD